MSEPCSYRFVPGRWRRSKVKLFTGEKLPSRRPVEGERANLWETRVEGGKGVGRAAGLKKKRGKTQRETCAGRQVASGTEGRECDKVRQVRAGTPSSTIRHIHPIHPIPRPVFRLILTRGRRGSWSLPTPRDRFHHSHHPHHPSPVTLVDARTHAGGAPRTTPPAPSTPWTTPPAPLTLV